jgi:peptidyl-prolyl cis-trans isomerase A (cyclophilin A)
MRNILIFLMLSLFLVACSSQSAKKNAGETSPSEGQNKGVAEQVNFTDLSNSVFKIQTYNGTRLLETGQCFVVKKGVLVAPFSLFEQADKAVLTPIGGGKSFETNKFLCYDRISNLILIQCDTLSAKPLNLYFNSNVNGLKTILIGEKQNNTLPLFSGASLQEKIVFGEKLVSISNSILTVNIGTPVFLSNGYVLGLGTAIDLNYERAFFAIPAQTINALLSKNEQPKPFSTIGNPNAQRNSAIKKIILETDYGNITIRLFNETPAYRDNFVKLAEEGYFDSLLIHRVIRDFGIQTGAADTRNAKSDDMVGWKGPGYTIPAHVVPGLYHKRGAIGSPRKPDSANKEKRSDGSQFYIVTGRKYLDDELSEIEKENKIKFTPEQRQVYKTVGGSPHIDGSYTVFGEVVSGLEIADRITLLPIQTDFRPVQDIRLKQVKIVY